MCGPARHLTRVPNDTNESIQEQNEFTARKIVNTVTPLYPRSSSARTIDEGFDQCGSCAIVT